jgi:hypothetical protein
MQNKTSLLLFFFFFSIFLKGQAAVELEHINVLLAEMDNPITIAVEDLPDSCLLVEVSTGRMNKSAKGHYAWYVSLDSNNATLTLTDTCHREQLCTRNYRIREIKSKILLGAMYHSCQMDAETFKAQLGIAAVLTEGGFDARCDIQSYHVRVVKKRYGKTLDGHNIGARFSGKILTWVQFVQTGDEIYFFQIMYQCPGMKAYRESTETLKFVIK